MSIDEITYIGIGIYVLELSLLTFGFFSLLLLCYMINKTKSFHRNFRDLYNIIILAYVIVIITRYVIVPFQILTEFRTSSFWEKYKPFFSHLHDLALLIYTAAFLFLAFERCLATIFAKTYERRFQSIWTSMFIWTSLNLVTAGVYYFLTTTGTNFYGITLLTVENIISATLSFVLMHNNRRIFKKTLTGTSRHGLSERYQIAENIKITRLVYPIIIFETVAKVVLLFVLFYIFIYPANVKDTRMLSHLFDVTLAFYIACMSWMFLLRHKPYRTVIINYVRRSHTSSNEVADIRILSTVNGERIIMEPTQKDYFDMLQKDWQQPRRVRSP
ncbi:Serpentine receptor class epsilon-6 [Toxocara canis]|uniref:Serpentine receptor class epsilon-6 n=1 Tax=Toxocara canis TaxID=6265 RepID=A0A0B2USF2_TOXCA|nr:Serpentine receptor class epsilon-6 [Toxocara canis]